MSCDEALRDRLLNRCREVHLFDSKIACTRIEDSWFESGWRKLNKRMPFANGDCFRHRHDLSHKLARRVACERQSGFDFSVLWKVFCVGEIKGAARRFKSMRTLLSSL